MADSNTITVNINAEVANFSKSVNMAETSLKKFENAAESVSNYLNDWSVGASRAGMIFMGLQSAVTSLISGLQGLTQAFTETGTLLDLTAQRTNISVESLSKLKYAAAQSGVEFETLADAVKTFQEQLGAARLGDSGSIDKLGAVGIRAEDFEGLNEEEQFLRLARHIAGIGDSATKTRTAIELFGDSGYMLLPFFNQGEEGIQKLCDEAERLGLVMSTSGAQSANALGSALASAQDSCTMLTANIGGLLAPAIEMSVGLLQDAIQAVSQITSVFPQTSQIIATGTATFTAFSIVAGGVASACSLLRGALIALSASNPLGWVVLGVGVLASLGMVLATITSKNEELEKATTRTNATLRETEKVSKNATDAINKLADGHKATVDMMTALNELAEKEKLSNDEKKKSVELVKELNKLYPKLNLVINETTGKVEDLTKKQIELLKVQNSQKKTELRALVKSETENVGKLEEERRRAFTIAGNVSDGRIAKFVQGYHTQEQWDSAKEYFTGALNEEEQQAFNNLYNIQSALIQSKNRLETSKKELAEADRKLKENALQIASGNVETAFENVNESLNTLKNATRFEGVSDFKKKFLEDMEAIEELYRSPLESIDKAIEDLKAQEELYAGSGLSNSKKIQDLETKRAELSEERQGKLDARESQYRKEQRKRIAERVQLLLDEKDEPELIALGTKDARILDAEGSVSAKRQAWADAVLGGGNVDKAIEELKDAELELAKTITTVSGEERRNARERLAKEEARYKKAEADGVDNKTLNEIADAVLKARERVDQSDSEYFNAIGTLDAARERELEDVTENAYNAETSRGTFSAYGVEGAVGDSYQQQMLEKVEDLRRFVNQMLGIKEGFV